VASREILGRTDELGALTELVVQLPKVGGAVVIFGDAGIGKSTLVRAAASLGRDADFLVLETTGVEAEAQLPFAGLHQLLRPIMSETDALPAAQRTALLSAFGIDEAHAPDLFMIALAALSLLADAAIRRPVLVVVDDAQWLDQPTHDVLAFIARRVRNDPIGIIASVRTGHSGPLCAAGLAELNLRGLDEASSRALLEVNGAGLSEPARDQILREALGNPLALVELPLAWRDATAHALNVAPRYLPLTDRLERTFAGRLAELSTPARGALLVAAVDSGDELAEILAAASVFVGSDVTVEVLDSAATSGLLRIDATRVYFRHPLARSAVLQSETLARRHAAHAALATVLDDRYRRVWHRAQSIVGQNDEVADELEASYKDSLRRGSVITAISALERSAELTTDSATRGRRLLLAGEHAFGLGRADMVVRLVDAASRTELMDLDSARMEWLREIFDDGVPGDAARVLELCDVAARAGQAGDADLALNLLLGASLRCWWADAGPVARGRVIQVTRQLTGVDGDPRYVATLGTAAPTIEGRTVVELLSGITVETVTDADTLRLLGQAAHAVGEPVLALDFLDRAETKLREQGRIGHLCQALLLQVLDRVELGDWERAAAIVDEGHRLAEETGQAIWALGKELMGAVVVAMRGDHERALQMAAVAEQAGGGRRLNDLFACVQLARGFAFLSAGRHVEAYEAFRRLFDPDDPAFHEAERFHAVMYLVEASIHAERRDDARAVIGGMEAVALVTPSATLHRQLSYARAVLAGNEDAEGLFVAALSADLVRWPLMRARLELAYGSWLRRHRRAADSRSPLRSAQSTFEVIGATSWAEQARTELRAAGERTSRREETAAGELLSPQELQIARLVAEGLSNREIGQRLFLSPRTVGSHLYRIFPKLDVTSRGQLASRLASRQPS
jgi:DNA-binding CsgD family transcriptional regulator